MFFAVNREETVIAKNIYNVYVSNTKERKWKRFWKSRKKYVKAKRHYRSLFPALLLQYSLSQLNNPSSLKTPPLWCWIRPNVSAFGTTSINPSIGPVDKTRYGITPYSSPDVFHTFSIKRRESNVNMSCRKSDDETISQDNRKLCWFIYSKFDNFESSKIFQFLRFLYDEWCNESQNWRKSGKRTPKLSV